jgi:hypothetical protein
VNKRYPWDKLKHPGTYFVWANRADEASLRSQANKQGKRRQIEISVEVLDNKEKLRVTYVRGLLE